MKQPIDTARAIRILTYTMTNKTQTAPAEAREAAYNAYMDARSSVTMTQTVYPKNR